MQADRHASLSRAIHAIPRNYLRNRREGLIFHVRGWNVLPRQWILRGRPGAAGPWSPAAVCSLGLLRIAMTDEDVENMPDLSRVRPWWRPRFVSAQQRTRC
jgi:hypothetical protein